MTKQVSVFAPAKINLCLHVTGQRADGLHLLDSLVCFADIGDQISACRAEKTSLTVTGPSASLVSDPKENLVLRAADLFGRGHPTAITLDKQLPVAAGLGGGSADAAATLHAMSQVWDMPLPPVSAQLRLGADLPVCVQGRPTRMTGIGEGLSELPRLPQIYVVLANSRTAVATGRVFQGLSQKTNPPLDPIPKAFASGPELCAWLRRQRNDLERPARAVAPDIDQVLAALAAQSPMLARMSGSGGSCFALFDKKSEAQAAAQAVARAQPKWWVRAGQILD